MLAYFAHLLSISFSIKHFESDPFRKQKKNIFAVSRVLKKSFFFTSFLALTRGLLMNQKNANLRRKCPKKEIEQRTDFVRAT